MIATVALLGIALRNTRVHSSSLERINIFIYLRKIGDLSDAENKLRGVTLTVGNKF